MNNIWLRIRFPLLGAGMFCLLAGVYAGLLRAGINIPAPAENLAASHGALMIGGFLGTVIGLERAVALGAPWGYAAPALAGFGTLLFLAGVEAGAAAVTLSSLLLVSIYGVVLRRQFSFFNAIMALGAAAWLAGNIYWLRGYPLPGFVLWWALFLVLTIAGERLELSRFLQHPPRINFLFAAFTALTVAGAVAAAGGAAWGNRLAGAGFILLSLWLLMYDVARRTVKQEGLTRFVAVCLLAGYVWLAMAGAMLAGGTELAPGYKYDALLHSLFLGFAFSMIFGHAPIIFPAVLNLAVPFRPVFYLHVAVLHLSLLMRVGGDHAMKEPLRGAGAALNGLALLIFLANTALSVRAGLISRRAQAPRAGGA
ncbi:MAG: hypothetical protein EPO63_08310 [Candidatus Nitrosotenuis sp.]|nr:MAG: hypothetical protein EPO63_08310 [Candidatus Nitrosotenuis sp.]